MRTRVADVDGIPLPLLESSLIPEAFSHGFPTRAGGVSGPPFESLNCTRHGANGDAREAVLENRGRILRALGIERLFVMKQVHGTHVVRIGPDDAPEGLDASGDAFVSDVRGAGLGVFSADCVPILFADARTGACGAAHAGWRGTVAGIGGATLAALVAAYGARPDEVRVAMGPAIGPCCFEVGLEVADAFEARHDGARDRGVVVPGRGSRPHVDLKRALRLELEAAGVPPHQIDAGDACTRCDPGGRFFSYRRDNGRGGGHMALIARRPVTSP